MRRPLLLAFCAALATPLAAAPPRAKEATSMFRGAYEPPMNEAHQLLHGRLKREQILETLADALTALRLPKRLLIRFAGCEGMSNAWYEPSDGTVTFCYEYVADLEAAAGGAVAHGIAQDTALIGGVVFVLLHETGHAIFDLLKVPILGREEDAADQVAAFLLLRAGKGVARRVLSGAAWMYLHDSKGRLPNESDFSDVHGLDAQRFYNVLCMAYGSDPKSFSGMVDKGYLPKERAEVCGEEFRQVSYAMQRLIEPSLDAAIWARTKARHRARWEAPKEPPPSAGQQPQ